MKAITQIESRTILTRASGFLEGYDYSLNPYRGCTFGCTYCYAAKHQYDRSLEQSWGQWLVVKANAPELLEAAGRRGVLAGASIYMSSVTDPYLPQEGRFGISRRCLEILVAHPPRRLVVQTRGILIERDVDLLGQLGGRLVVSFSLPTDDEEVRKVMEPTCSSVERRLAALRVLHDAGIRAYATIAPTLPCNPCRLAVLLEGRVEGVIVSGLHDDGSDGWSLPIAARQSIQANGWEHCLRPDHAPRVAEAMRDVLGDRVHLGREGFLRLARRCDPPNMAPPPPGGTMR